MKSGKLSIFVNLCRGLLALTFLFSGLVKANDPVGTQIKLDEYLAAMGLQNLSVQFTLAVAIGLAVLEFALGVYIVVSHRRRITSVSCVALMTIMTVLTVWIYVADPVSDCGCFGDVIVLTNGQTLLKNIVLLAAAIVTMRWYRLQPTLLKGGWAWLATTVPIIAVTIYAIYCVIALPQVDFRPYKVGVNLAKLTGKQAARPQFDVKIVYRRGDETMELAADDEDPDSTWEYVETRSIPVRNSDRTSLETANFYILDPETEDDITGEVVNHKGYTLLLIVPSLAKADQGCAGYINELYDYTLEHDVAFYCLTASDEQAQLQWIYYTGAEYPFYQSDEQVLQTMVRANPGLMLLHNGVIMEKWSNWQMPTVAELDFFE